MSWRRDKRCKNRKITRFPLNTYWFRAQLRYFAKFHLCINFVCFEKRSYYFGVAFSENLKSNPPSHVSNAAASRESEVGMHELD